MVGFHLKPSHKSQAHWKANYAHHASSNPRTCCNFSAASTFHANWQLSNSNNSYKLCTTSMQQTETFTKCFGKVLPQCYSNMTSKTPQALPSPVHSNLWGLAKHWLDGSMHSKDIFPSYGYMQQNSKELQNHFQCQSNPNLLALCSYQLGRAQLCTTWQHSTVWNLSALKFSATNFPWCRTPPRHPSYYTWPIREQHMASYVHF